MKMKMKKIILVIFFINGIVGTHKVFAQMQNAQPIIWDIIKEVNINASQTSVWNFLNDVSMFKSLSNGFVSSADIVSGKNPLTLNLVFADGSNRLESVVQSDAENKFMVIEFDEKSLPKEVSSVQIAIFTKEKDNSNSIISWNARIDGDKIAKKVLIDQLKAEFDSYAIGYSKITNPNEK
jgi:hypothetical protein